MISRKERSERMNARCEKLEQLGFRIHHEDSFIEVRVGFEKVMVDFSAIAEEHFMEHALKEVFKEGQRQGRNELRTAFSKLMTLEEDD